MKPLRFIVVTLALAALVLVPVGAIAQDAATARNQLISEHCKSVQGLISGAQRRDLVSRTNLGREYESITKELTAFGQRVRNNGINAQPYDQLLSQLNDATSQFRDAYVHYDDSVNNLLAINCQAKPADFDAQLATTRSLRDTTEGATTHAAALVGQYRDTAAELQSQLNAEGRAQ